jgi:excisionase family DNA binding protein
VDKTAPYLSLAEVRHELHVSDSTARRLIADGELVAYKFGRQIRVHPEDVKAYIARNRVAAPAI